MTRVTRHLGAIVVGAVVATSLVATADAQLATPNPWTERRVLNIAHQGGEVEAPSDTLFAFKTAKEKGADVLELDVHATADGEIVVLHDATVDRTTNGTGRVDEMTLEEIKSLDAAHWFVPDCGTCHNRDDDAYTYRGFATGERAIPAELGDFDPNDFKIPTLREVLETFPRDFINVEIKSSAPDTTPYEEDLAVLLQEYGRSTDTIVVSFLDQSVEIFKLFAPEVSTATGTAETGAFWATTQGPLPGAPNARHHALQVPITFEGITVVTEEFVTEAHANGFAVHVWTINDRDTMEWLIDIGVDGVMTDRPTLLEEVLGSRHVKYKPNKKNQTSNLLI